MKAAIATNAKNTETTLQIRNFQKWNIGKK